MSLIDRISTGINRLADRTTQVLDEGRLRLDLMRARRRKDNVARDLGYVAYRQAKGTAPSEGEVEALVRRIDDVEQAITTLEDELRRARGKAAPAS